MRHLSGSRQFSSVTPNASSIISDRSHPGVLNDIVYVPLHHQVIVWAMRESLDVPVFPFNLSLFREARLK